KNHKKKQLPWPRQVNHATPDGRRRASPRRLRVAFLCVQDHILELLGRTLSTRMTIPCPSCALRASLAGAGAGPALPATSTPIAPWRLKPARGNSDPELRPPAGPGPSRGGPPGSCARHRRDPLPPPSRSSPQEPSPAQRVP